MSSARDQRYKELLRGLEAEQAQLLAERDEIAWRLRQVRSALSALGREPGQQAPGGDGPQDALTAAIRASPNQEWTADIAYEVLRAKGWESASRDPLNVVRSTLAALRDAGVVRRVARGRYVAINSTGESR